MTVIGLTGSIASGKSLVAAVLKEKGAVVIDADIVAREVVEPGTEGWNKLRTEFGDDILNLDGSINRKALGNMVFARSDSLKRLNNILHPIIVKEISGKINLFRAGSENQVMVIDAPLLIETGMHCLVDEVWVVEVPDEVQIRRLMERDRLTREQALARIKSQMPVQEKKKYADIVIDNNRNRDDTRKAVAELWETRFGKFEVEAVEETVEETKK
ncbi:dephospho-CoA kinase [Phosphitispora sp. TUW77]|uniref:dephospho-CoA kinase n=1 Tax=Phosphitispora sp. TUW77 TaxID=3152361 RepID=UPI003AB349E6